MTRRCRPGSVTCLHQPARFRYPVSPSPAMMLRSVDFRNRSHRRGRRTLPSATFKLTLIEREHGSGAPAKTF